MFIFYREGTSSSQLLQQYQPKEEEIIPIEEEEAVPELSAEEEIKEDLQEAVEEEVIEEVPAVVPAETQQRKNSKSGPEVESFVYKM